MVSAAWTPQIQTPAWHSQPWYRKGDSFEQLNRTCLDSHVENLDSYMVGIDLHVCSGLCAAAVACTHDVESAEDGGGGKEDPVER